LPYEQLPKIWENGILAKGQDVESRFFELFKKHRDNCRKASLDEQFDHTDIICGDMKIDVKSMKRVNGLHVFRMSSLGLNSKIPLAWKDGYLAAEHT
jgi:hypothetical protein